MSTGTYRSRTRDQRIADEVTQGHMACGHCHNLTLTDDLAKFGGRCYPCYDAFCHAASDGAMPPRSIADKVEILARLRRVLAGMNRDPKAWAHRLRAREAAGEPLTPFQREAWRSGLNLPMSEPA